MILTDEEIQQAGAAPTELVLAPRMSIRREWDSRLSFARAIEKAVLLKLEEGENGFYHHICNKSET